MAPERRNQIALAVLGAILIVVIYRGWSETSAPPSSASNESRPAGAHATAPGTPAVPDVHLDALHADRPEPQSTGRDLFRFKSKAAPPPVTAPVQRPVETAPPPSGPPPPPPVPPITLKFIGKMAQEDGKPTLAVFSDGVGPPMIGPEGGVLAGRYRILKIGAESVEIAYLDGRGRTTIRLTGG